MNNNQGSQDQNFTQGSKTNKCCETQSKSKQHIQDIQGVKWSGLCVECDTCIWWNVSLWGHHFPNGWKGKSNGKVHNYDNLAKYKPTFDI